MIRLFTLTFSVLMLALSGVAIAGGIPEAEHWSWARDGGRILNSLVVLGALSWIVIKFGGPMLNKRAELIAENFAALEKSRKKAEATLAKYEQKIKTLKAEEEKILAESLAEGEKMKNKLLEKAQASADKIVEKAAERIRIQSEQAKKRLKQEAMLTAINMAEKILCEKITSKDQKNILAEYVKGLEKTN